MNAALPPFHLNLETTTLHYLMSRYAQCQCPGLAIAIVQHLRLLKQQPSLTEKQRKLYDELLDIWEQLAMPATSSGGVFETPHLSAA